MSDFVNANNEKMSLSETNSYRIEHNVVVYRGFNFTALGGSQIKNVYEMLITSSTSPSPQHPNDTKCSRDSVRLSLTFKLKKCK